jgi:hypothetical protein
MSKYIDDNDVLKLDTDLFLLLLNNDLIACNLPVEVCNPLTPADFSDMKLGNTITDVLDDITFFMKHGFNDSDPTHRLTKDQWFRAATQTIAAIHQGLYNTFLVDNAKTFIATLSPDGNKATRTLALATKTLNYFFTNPLTSQQGDWQQCARCLKVSSPSITEANHKALLLRCNQDADATRLTILNATIRSFHKKAVTWTSSLRAKAQDQMILEVVTTNPPPFKSDLKVIEWVRRHAEVGREAAEAMATEEAVNAACATYEHQLAIMEEALAEDLEKICAHHLNVLEAEREKGVREIATLKANLKAERQQRKDDIEADQIIGKQAKRCHARPNPLVPRETKKRMES